MGTFTRLPPTILSNPMYRKFDLIGRAMHIDDVETCIQNGKLSSYKVVHNAHSCLVMTNMEVMWFGVVGSPIDDNWYGNVSFQIKLKDLLDYNDDLKLYYIDHVQFNKDTISRVLITAQPRSTLPSDIVEVDLENKGHPLWMDDSGRYHAMYNHSRIDSGAFSRYGHSVEIVIDASGNLAQYLYDNCTRVPVGHSLANSRGLSGYKDKVCFKFNKKSKKCPFSFDREKTTLTMNAAAPGFWNNCNSSNIHPQYYRYEYEDEEDAREDFLYSDYFENEFYDHEYCDLYDELEDSYL